MLTSLLEIVRQFAVEHQYILMFIGFFVAGETIFLPSLYLAIIGKADLRIVVTLRIVANTLADIMWYTVGRYVPEERLHRFLGPRLTRKMTQLGAFFESNPMKVIFTSKFLYGTRIAVQVLSGFFKTPFLRHVAVTFLGVVALTTTLTFSALGATSSLQALLDGVHAIKTAFLSFVVVVVLAYFVLGRITSMRWFDGRPS